MDPQAIIWTEGKTDWQHLKRAFSALHAGQQIAFHESDVDFGDDRLFKQCLALAEVNQSVPTLFLFDRDNDQIVNKVVDPGRNFKAWGNNVYSFPIPVPPHRAGEPGICIELYYTDDELRTKDEAGRRLFLSSEFNPTSGRTYASPSLSIGNKNRIPPATDSPKRIIDCEVYDENSKNVALSKAEFARHVREQRGAFGCFRYDSFRAILVVIDDITAEATHVNELIFGDFHAFLKSVDGLDAHSQLASLLDRAIRICKLATMIFVAATVRHYEQQIVEAVGTDHRKLRPIRHLLADSFGAPSLTTLQKLARHCYHLIDDRAPRVLVILKALMAEAPTLGPVGDMLEQLDQVLPPARSVVRTLSKRDARKPILDYIIPELAKFESRIQELTDTASAAGSLRAEADPIVWRQALYRLVTIFAPLNDLTVRVRTLERVRSDTDEFLGRTVTYYPKQITSEDLIVKHGDLEDDRLESYELLSEGDAGPVSLELFPFLTAHSGRICFYCRTRSLGYEYHPAFGPTGHVRPTKRKFSHLALRVNSSSDFQGLFWAQATPSTSATGVKANIPARESIVGRKQQISEVLSDIIEIPNQNGIIYGPGGVGKTALLIELSRQLFESPAERVQFKNIIWISAKRDSHDPTLGVTETRLPQYQSMDNVLDAIMEFQGFEDASGYDRQDKKTLVIESFREEKTLLILDNLETVPRVAQEEIIGFFGLEVKRALRDKPDYFKVLVTSRELIPSGFHQMELRGPARVNSFETLPNGVY